MIYLLVVQMQSGKMVKKVMYKITNKEAKERIQRALDVPSRISGLVLIDEESANIAVEKLSERYMGCHGCRHYDSLQTSVICYDCSRAYKDRYEE